MSNALTVRPSITTAELLFQFGIDQLYYRQVIVNPYTFQVTTEEGHLSATDLTNIINSWGIDVSDDLSSDTTLAGLMLAHHLTIASERMSVDPYEFYTPQEWQDMHILPNAPIPPLHPAFHSVRKPSSSVRPSRHTHAAEATYSKETETSATIGHASWYRRVLIVGHKTIVDLLSDVSGEILIVTAAVAIKWALGIHIELPR